LLYRDSFMKRMLAGSPEQLAARGFNSEMVERLKIPAVPTPVEKMIARAGNPSRTIKLIRNYLHLGVYVLHGEKDNVVPTFLARDMRERLGKFHNDFTYYEYPGGEHWYGDHSMDWPPLFEFFKQRSIKSPETIENLEFFTGSPGVSARSNFITIHQQEHPFEISSFKFSKGKIYEIATDNTATLQIDLNKTKDSITELKIDETLLNVSPDELLYLRKTNEKWEKTKQPSLQEKGPHRNGGFKDAFRNNVVFVYGTSGNATENNWNYNKALFDAETFWYRANGNVEVVRDRDFKLSDYPDRNVILYGNGDTNAAWEVLLGGSEVQVKRNSLTIGSKSLTGDNWGMYFVVPRTDSDIASVGVVAATGNKGMKASYANHYMVNGTTFPDLLLFDNSVLIQGAPEVKCAGFFGNDWSVEKGEFKWK